MEEPEVELDSDPQPEVFDFDADDDTGLDVSADLHSADLESRTGLHVITIVYDDESVAPTLHLGGTSPWLAYGIFAAAIETLGFIRPPLGVTFNGETILDMGDDEDEDF